VPGKKPDREHDRSMTPLPARGWWEVPEREGSAKSEEARVKLGKAQLYRGSTAAWEGEETGAVADASLTSGMFSKKPAVAFVKGRRIGLKPGGKEDGRHRRWCGRNFFCGEKGGVQKKGGNFLVK